MKIGSFAPHDSDVRSGLLDGRGILHMSREVFVMLSSLPEQSEIYVIQCCCKNGNINHL